MTYTTISVINVIALKDMFKHGSLSEMVPGVCMQVLSVSAHTGGLWLVGSHLTSGIWGGGVGGHQAQCGFSAEQGAAVEDVECDCQPTH